MIKIELNDKIYELPSSFDEMDMETLNKLTKIKF